MACEFHHKPVFIIISLIINRKNELGKVKWKFAPLSTTNLLSDSSESLQSHLTMI